MKHPLLIIIILITSPFYAYADPQLIWSSYLGGFDEDYSNCIKVDTTENAHIFGFTLSSDYPTTYGAYNRNFELDSIYYLSYNYFITKFNSSGIGLIFSTFIGHSKINIFGHDDYSHPFIIDKFGNSYFLWYPNKTFPVKYFITDSSKRLSETDVYLTKINSNGDSIIFTTFVGNGNSQNMVLDSLNNIYIIGKALFSYPTTFGAFDTVNFYNDTMCYTKSFITKINADGSNIIYSTLLSCEQAYDIAVDNEGNSYIASNIGFKNKFPTTYGAYDTIFNWFDGGVTKFNSNGSDLIYSTFIGGSGEDAVHFIKLGKNKNAIVIGASQSSDFPITKNILDSSYGGHEDAFISKLNSTGDSLIFSSYFGSNGNDKIDGFDIDDRDYIYITGCAAGATDFQITKNAIFKSSHDRFGFNNFFSIIDSSCSNLEYSSWLGYLFNYYGAWKFQNSITVDLRKKIYISSSRVDSFPSIITPYAYDKTYNGNGDISITKYAQCNGLPAILTSKNYEFHPIWCDTIIVDTFYVFNPDSCFLLLNKLTITGSDSSQFSILNLPDDYYVVEGKDSVSLVIQFKPKDNNGIKKATLTIYNNSLDSIRRIALMGYNSTFLINNRESDTIIIDIGKICTGADKDTTITLTNKGLKGTTFKIENKDPHLLIQHEGKAGKGKGDVPQGTKKKRK
jgi:hypothetical protein